MSFYDKIYYKFVRVSTTYLLLKKKTFRGNLKKIPISYHTQNKTVYIDIYFILGLLFSKSPSAKVKKLLQFTFETLSVLSVMDIRAGDTGTLWERRI